MVAQGALKRRRLDVCKENSELLNDNISELRDAELRDSNVQTKVGVRVGGGGGEGETRWPRDAYPIYKYMRILCLYNTYL